MFLFFDKNTAIFQNVQMRSHDLTYISHENNLFRLYTSVKERVIVAPNQWKLTAFICSFYPRSG